MKRWSIDCYHDSLEESGCRSGTVEQSTKNYDFVYDFEYDSEGNYKVIYFDRWPKGDDGADIEFEPPAKGFRFPRYIEKEIREAAKKFQWKQTGALR